MSYEANNVFATPMKPVVWKFGAFDGRKNVKLTVRDALGSPVTFSLTGGGYGELTGGGAFDTLTFSATRKANSSACSPLSLGSQWVW